MVEYMIFGSIISDIVICFKDYKKDENITNDVEISIIFQKGYRLI